MTKVCACGRVMCPICKGKKFVYEAKGSPLAKVSIDPGDLAFTHDAKGITKAVVTESVTERDIIDVVVTAGVMKDGIVTDVVIEYRDEGFTVNLPCRCGCDASTDIVIESKYATDACRQRAKRERDSG